MKPIRIEGEPKLIKEFEDFAEIEGYETDIKLKGSSMNLDGNPDMYIHLLTAIGTPLATLLTTYIIQHNNKRKVKLTIGPDKKEIEIEGNSISEIETLLSSVKDVVSIDITQTENKQ